MNAGKFNHLLLLLVALLANSSAVCQKSKSTINDDSLRLKFTTTLLDLEGIKAKFSENIHYAAHQRTVFDILLPESAEPVPLVIQIHGGGFKHGDKKHIYFSDEDSKQNFPEDIRALLRNNIAFANINYRLLNEFQNEGILGPMKDSKRCLQFIRAHAEELNIDATRIALVGSSAGGGTALWLALNDDMADTLNSDPVLRESTRVTAVAVRETQATYDVLQWQTAIFPEYEMDIEKEVCDYPKVEKGINELYGITDFGQVYWPMVVKYRKQLDLLSLMSSDDPELWLSNLTRKQIRPKSASQILHHPNHVRALKKQADLVNIPTVVYYTGYKDPSGESFSKFLIRKLKK
jgi:para-nitrobenzyl esterase